MYAFLVLVVPNRGPLLPYTIRTCHWQQLHLVRIYAVHNADPTPPPPEVRKIPNEGALPRMNHWVVFS